MRASTASTCYSVPLGTGQNFRSDLNAGIVTTIAIIQSRADEQQVMSAGGRDLRQRPRQVHLQRLRGLGGDADGPRLRAISLARDLHRVFAGQDLQGKEVGEAQEIAVEADLRPRRAGGDGGGASRPPGDPGPARSP